MSLHMLFPPGMLFHALSCRRLLMLHPPHTHCSDPSWASAAPMPAPTLPFSSLRSQPQYPDHLLFLQDPGAADSLPPTGTELGSCGQWDQPECPRCSHIQPSPVWEVERIGGERSLVPSVSHRRWPYGSDGCQAHGFQGFVTALASICSSAAIAWGRYHHYCTRSQLAWNSAISLVLFVWLSSAFWAALPLLGWGHYDYEPLGTCCTLDYSKGDRNFTSFLFTMSFFNFAMPLFITITSYSLMEQKLGKSGHLQVPALIAKTVPTINAINYALGNEMVCRGIWQCLSPQKSEKDRTK
ncbi:RPE-retinal G protein-coupled receptor isoform X5 [Pan paniscus]|uniref:RPE-retinal G protein-coupled receptor isoform X5 n=1 Tax=Pan paniscus TaxID=9597 RepID=UPI002436C437|nr:RPE-retinal G protein-coupled receptor isoform X2 [Pan paniscus]